VEVGRRTLGQLAGEPLAETVAEHPDLPQRLLQVVRGDRRELLELGVRACELPAALLDGGRAFGDAALERQIEAAQLVVRLPQRVAGDERAPEEDESRPAGEAERGEEDVEKPAVRAR